MSNVISIDFEGVEGGGVTSVLIPEGDYGLKIAKVMKRTGKDSKKDYLLFSLKVISGNEKGMNKTIPHTCSLSKNALWNLRNLLEAAGKNIPAKAIKIDLDKLTGLTVGGSVVDDEYDGKRKSVVGAFFPISELNAVPASSDDDDEVTGDHESTEEAGTEEEEELFG